jgi:hypothetical protein
MELSHHPIPRDFGRRRAAMDNDASPLMIDEW